MSRVSRKIRQLRRVEEPRSVERRKVRAGAQRGEVFGCQNGVVWTRLRPHGEYRRRVVGVCDASETSFVHRGVGGLERSGVLRGTFRNGFEIQRCGGKDDERTRGW